MKFRDLDIGQPFKFPIGHSGEIWVKISVLKYQELQQIGERGEPQVRRIPTRNFEVTPIKL